MDATLGPPSFRGRSIGIVILVAMQVLVGLVHVVFGFWLLVASPEIYSVYTTVYSLLTLLFVVGLWRGRSWGWIGAVAVSFFVMVADALTLLNLPSIPGIPKFAGFGEISYSVVVVAYLMQAKLRMKFGIQT